VITKDATSRREITARIVMAKQLSTRSRIFPPTNLDLNLGKKLVKFNILSIAWYGAGTWGSVVVKALRY